MITKVICGLRKWFQRPRRSPQRGKGGVALRLHSRFVLVGDGLQFARLVPFDGAEGVLNKRLLLAARVCKGQSFCRLPLRRLCAFEKGEEGVGGAIPKQIGVLVWGLAKIFPVLWRIRHKQISRFGLSFPA